MLRSQFASTGKMTTDDGLHLFGTEPTHLPIPLGLTFGGQLLGIDLMAGIGMGMLLVLLFGNMRAQAPRYRWRVDK